MPKDNGNGTSGNVNLGLNFLTLDDLIRRLALNSGISQERLGQEYPELRDDFGRRVFGGKVVIVRPDLNSGLRQTEEGNYEIDGIERIEASVPTIRELSGYGARVVLIAHQGRAGREDCTSLEPHKRVLEDLLQRNVLFELGHWYGTSTQRIIRELKTGGIFLLDNIRKLTDDDQLGTEDPRMFANRPHSHMEVLGSLADFFVNDGFPVSHRWQGSVVGFPYILNIAGRQMEREIIGSRAQTAHTSHPYTMLLGGVKITDYLEMVGDSLKGGIVDNVLATGAFGIMGVLGVQGREDENYLGRKTVQFLQEMGIYKALNTVTGFARRYTRKFVLPLDFKVELDGKVYIMTPQEINGHSDKDRMSIYGIGPQTVAKFKEIMETSKTIYMKGSPTKDDDERFLPESKGLVDIMAALTKKGRVTILSGGHTTTLVKDKFGYSLQEDFTSYTLAGGAATEFRAGTLLPGLLTLNTSYNAFNGLPLNNGLGNYQLGFELVAPRIPKNLMPLL